MDRLESVRLKLGRARHHLNGLDESIQRFSQAHILDTRTERDREGKVVLILNQLPQIRPHWNIAIGECVHNMRSALDHLAYWLNVIGGGDPPPNFSESEFPIYDNGPDFHGTRNPRRTKPARNKIKHMPPPAQALIERLQPYHRRKDPDTWTLLMLRDLANWDKHRGFPFTVSTIWGAITPNRVAGHIATDWNVPYRPLKPNAPCADLSVPTLPPNEKPDVKFGAALTVEFNRGTRKGLRLPLRMPHEPVTPLLRELLEFIEGRAVPDLIESVSPAA